jgi:hydrogenase maturation protease
MAMPENVEVIDAGTSGLAILDMILGARKAIIVDATMTGAKPGTVQRLALNQLSSKDLHEVSLHDLSFIEALRMGSEVLPEQMPKQIVIVGIEAESTVKPRVGLSPCVGEAIPEALSVILSEIQTI